MTHPSREQWMAYLYGELERKSKAAMAAHLGSCPDCHTQVGAWQSAMTDLDAWKLPPARNRRRALRPLVQWAIAATLLVGLGYAAGRLSPRAAANADPPSALLEARLQALESSLKTSLREELSTALAGELAEELAGLRADLGEQLAGQTEELVAATLLGAREENGRLLAALTERHELARLQDRQLIAEMLAELESRRRADHAALRRDLSVLALLTGEEFFRTKQGIAELLTCALPEGSVPEVEDRSDSFQQRSPQ